MPERLEYSAARHGDLEDEDIVPHTATAKNGFDSNNLDKG